MTSERLGASTHVEANAAAGPGYISTGHLPTPDLVMATVKRAYDRFRGNTEGRNSDVYPALARVPSDLFGVCVVGDQRQCLSGR